MTQHSNVDIFGSYGSSFSPKDNLRNQGNNQLFLSSMEMLRAPIPENGRQTARRFDGSATGEARDLGNGKFSAQKVMQLVLDSMCKNII